MAYKRGNPLINFSFFFRTATLIVFYIVWIIAQCVVLLLYSTRYEGRKKLTRFKGNAVLVSNHTSYLDPVMISGAAMPRTMYHTLLEATVLTPFFGTFVRLLGGVPLPPGLRGLEKLIECTKTAFRYKHFVHFYPEGELSLNNQNIEPFKFGAFYTAAKLNVPLIPIVTVFCEGRLKPHTFFARKFPKQKLVVLDPYDPKDFTRYTENGEIDITSMKDFAETVRLRMQEEINSRRKKNPRDGTQSYYKGKAARIKGINA
ncbi:MAG: 1-acyl-sn-glycerol-3-phosphate acyltransferase [Spirochaetaceae bacterium]|jgi:1-acyl-sn-glycerol-3-phosphate acyltransferase|nr:1-acyl-sn-glycerol-3-phosphate acyltransferase [Spirochaetaceae bacterium]